MLEGKKIILGISGGIAAYKVATVASLLTKLGAEVHVAMTPSAEKFIGALTFGSLTANPVQVTTWPQNNTNNRDDWYPHLYPATDADLFCVAPATANTIAKITYGLGEEPVSLNALSLPNKCQRLFCPAMNAEMWQNDAVQDNVATLLRRGWQQIGPESGRLACGVIGEGRMSEPETIVNEIRLVLLKTDDLAGKKVMILSGPTVEHFDPVRFLSNHSSGIMGRELADQSLLSGAEVHFVTGPVPNENLPSGNGLHIYPVQSARDMLEQATKLHKDVDIVIFVAAVADYHPANEATEKLPKDQAFFDLNLTLNPDIAATLGKEKSDKQIHIGFALETKNGLDNAHKKLKNKNFDAILLNGQDSFGSLTGHYTIVSETSSKDLGKVSKVDCAKEIIQYLN
ncbi:MAG: bifunctional phosphopantothenoylcysteine decarboxylase/phosphopantothenate--cysteine ligase CoaBC [Lentisphaeria bacterium]|nr:bifunctional phosphopantothenoylcysteine decarboxylase/phosphopantothenate--cysteine ligase CoaBC [Lentisphaeria bacterium]